MVEQHIKANMGIYSVPAVVHAVQEDTARVFIFDIVDYEIQGTETASLMCERPDGSAYSYSGTVSAADNTVTVALNIAGGALSQVGVVKAQLVMTISSKVVCSFKMGIIVQEKVGGPATQDDKDFLSGLQAQMDAYIATATADITQNTNDIASIQTQLNTLVGFKRFNIGSSSSGTLTFKSGSYSRAFLICNGYSVGTKGVYIVTCTNTGTMSVVDVLAGSNISYTTGSYTMSISNSNTGNAILIQAIIFAGDVT